MKRKMVFVVFAALMLAAFSLSVVGCASQGPTGTAQGVLSEERGPYPDGRYRGTFHDSNFQQVGVEFYLEDNRFYDLTFRVLSYGGNNFLDSGNPDNAWPQADVESLSQQYGQMLAWLDGKDITEISKLTDTPEVAAADVEGSGEVVAGIDVWTAATMRGSKITSAIRDGLNRGLY